MTPCTLYVETIQCSTNLSASGAVPENDVIVVTCSIKYSGSWAPVMRWFNYFTRHNFTDDDITLAPPSDKTVTSQLTVTASAGIHGSQIICETYFTLPSTSLSTNATNVPNYTDTWMSTEINVLSWRK